MIHWLIFNYISQKHKVYYNYAVHFVKYLFKILDLASKQSPDVVKRYAPQEYL